MLPKYLHIIPPLLRLIKHSIFPLVHVADLYSLVRGGSVLNVVNVWVVLILLWHSLRSHFSQHGLTPIACPCIFQQVWLRELFLPSREALGSRKLYVRSRPRRWSLVEFHR